MGPTDRSVWYALTSRDRCTNRSPSQLLATKRPSGPGAMARAARLEPTTSLRRSSVRLSHTHFISCSTPQKNRQEHSTPPSFAVADLSATIGKGRSPSLPPRLPRSDQSMCLTIPSASAPVFVFKHMVAKVGPLDTLCSCCDLKQPQTQLYM